MLYPGRPNGGPGPDFKDAIVQMEGSPPVRGDVEVHRQTTGWNQHGHNQDPRYNKVVLHVVARPTARAATYRQDGRVVPVIMVGPQEGSHQLPDHKATVGAAFSRLRRWRTLPQEHLCRLLNQAGEQRLLSKSARFRAALIQEDAEELLYCGILEALGYSRNRQPFLELAHRLPWRMLRDNVSTVPLRSQGLAIHHLLLTVAGLSGKTPTVPEEASFPGETRHLRDVTPMEPSAWCFAGVRPVNQPRRRIAGAAVLLAAYVETGLLPGLLPLARKGSVTPLRGALTVVDDRITLIGRGRALDMVVNVVLPLVHAWGLLKGDRVLADSCLNLYRRAPPLAENEITREMEALLGLSEGWAKLGALQQQGLMHLYQTLLREGTLLAGTPGISPAGVTVTKTIEERPRRYDVAFLEAMLSSTNLFTNGQMSRSANATVLVPPSNLPSENSRQARRCHDTQKVPGGF